MVMWNTPSDTRISTGSVAVMSCSATCLRPPPAAALARSLTPAYNFNTQRRGSQSLLSLMNSSSSLYPRADQLGVIRVAHTKSNVRVDIQDFKQGEKSNSNGLDAARSDTLHHTRDTKKEGCISNNTDAARSDAHYTTQEIQKKRGVSRTTLMQHDRTHTTPHKRYKKRGVYLEQH
jgi:hypothetical protein